MVNLMGAFIIGAAMAYFMRHPQLDPAWKLLIVTGLCGGLTTFSTFSVEVFSLLQTGNYLSALTSVLVHVVGSLLMTAAGFYLFLYNTTGRLYVRCSMPASGIVRVLLF